MGPELSAIGKIFDKNSPVVARLVGQLCNTHNYLVCSNKMGILLREKKRLDLVPLSSFTGSESPGAQSKTDDCIRDAALSLLLMSIKTACKGSIMTVTDPASVWNRLKKLCSAVSEAAIDTKPFRPYWIKMGSGKSGVEYSNHIDPLVLEFQTTGNHVWKLKKKRKLLKRLKTDFKITAEIISANKTFHTSTVLQLIISKTNTTENDENDCKALLLHS